MHLWWTWPQRKTETVLSIFSCPSLLEGQTTMTFALDNSSLMTWCFWTNTWPTPTWISSSSRTFWVTTLYLLTYLCLRKSSQLSFAEREYFLWYPFRLIWLKHSSSRWKPRFLHHSDSSWGSSWHLQGSWKGQPGNSSSSSNNNNNNNKTRSVECFCAGCWFIIMWRHW